MNIVDRIFAKACRKCNHVVIDPKTVYKISATGWMVNIEKEYYCKKCQPRHRIEVETDKDSVYFGNSMVAPFYLKLISGGKEGEVSNG